jgi:glycosyltransferase involved in cell wall biosynthesis
VLSIGRIVPQEVFDTLLRAWAMISDPNARLIIAGDGPELENLEELARDLNIREATEFLGPADRETVPRLFAGATAVVVPSLAGEGLRLVSIEAMASGRPLVVTRSGGVAEAVPDGENGLIVERGDQQSIARALQRILNDGELAASLGRAAQQRAWPSIGSLSRIAILMVAQHSSASRSNDVRTSHRVPLALLAKR